MRVFVFIDTNVLLHFRFFTDVDWAKELRVQEATLVFAPAVLAELDRHKRTGSRQEKARAQAAIKKLFSLGLSVTSVEIRPGVRVMGLDAEPPDDCFERHRLDRREFDDRILASFLDFTESRPKDRALVLSDDLGLNIKAGSRRIEIVRPREELENRLEPDDVERELETTKRDLARFQNAAPRLQLAFAGSGTLGQFVVTLVRPFNYQELDRLKEAWRKEHPHIGVTPTAFPDMRGGISSLKMLEGFPGYVSEEDAQKRNAAIDRYFEKYCGYLREWPLLVNGLKRILPFNLVLENTGTAPADDIDVEFWTEAPGQWLEEPPALPAPPAVPRARSMFDSIADLQTPYLRDFVVPGLRDVSANEDGPHISGDDSGQRVQYIVKRVKHHVPCELPVVYFQFGADEDIGSFTVHVRLVAANITEPSMRTLDVKVSRGALTVPPVPGRTDDEGEAEDDD